MGEHAMSAKAFGRKLGTRPSIEPKLIGHTNQRGWKGIRVLTAEAAQAEKRYWDE
jgi:hypothetical protein